MSTAPKVTMRHPDLGEMQVLPLTVPSWRARGWEVVEDEPSPPPASVEQPGKEEPPHRRRKQKESE